ncbi:MAG: OmpH family outer membrane protein [Gemmatimonadota bacterium]|nr:MAG: OmpH family outer membrane protein [Gemmatimonadota bacterium]
MQYKLSAILVATALAALGYTGLSQPQGSQIKLAYINSNEIISQAPGAADAQATFEREMAGWQAQVEALADSLQQMVTQYEQQQVMLSPEARQARQQEINQKRAEFQRRTTELEQTAQRRQQELVAPIYEMISSMLSQVREEQQYTMIFDAAAGALIAADTTLDITDLVLQRLRAQSGEQEGPSN